MQFAEFSQKLQSQIIWSMMLPKGKQSHHMHIYKKGHEQPRKNYVIGQRTPAWPHPFLSHTPFTGLQNSFIGLVLLPFPGSTSRKDVHFLNHITLGSTSQPAPYQVIFSLGSTRAMPLKNHLSYLPVLNQHISLTYPHRLKKVQKHTALMKRD